MPYHEFSNWISWLNRHHLEGIGNPGVYCIAISEINISNSAFDWIQAIKYVGMTNSKSGLKGRLQQFDNAIKGKSGHGGAQRFRFQHRDYQKLVNNLYVSVFPFQCDVSSNTPRDLRKMGKVAEFEYECFATYVEKWNALPEFNDKKTRKLKAGSI